MLPNKICVCPECRSKVYALYLLPWGNKELFHKLLSLVTLHQAPKELDALTVSILASVKHSLQTSMHTDGEEEKGCPMRHTYGSPSAQAIDHQDTCFEQAKQKALFHKNTDGRGWMVPIETIVYNGCTQNIHQRPHCLHITLPWGNKKHNAQRVYTDFPPRPPIFVYYISICILQYHFHLVSCTLGHIVCILHYHFHLNISVDYKLEYHAIPAPYLLSLFLC